MSNSRAQHFWRHHLLCLLCRCWLALLTLVPLAVHADGLVSDALNPVQPTTLAKLVIVVDDIGYNFRRDRRAVELPGPITVAVMPFAPHSLRLAKIAEAQGKEVILHQPMQRSRTSKKPAKGLLTQDMTESEFDQTLANNLGAIPNIIGLNNHAGSLLTAQRAPMQRLMQQLSSRQLYFLDSRTTPDTVAFEIARSSGVPSLARDVFLDNNRDPNAIHRQFQHALRIARKRGYAVLIAHPYPESLDYLHDALYAMPMDVEVQTLSAAMPQRPAAAQLAGAQLRELRELRPLRQTELGPLATREFPRKSPGQ